MNGSRWRSWGAAVALVAGWYLLAWIVVRPLSDAPVVDSWLYQHAVEALWRTGHLQFAGFTEAERAGQVVWLESSPASSIAEITVC